MTKTVERELDLRTVKLDRGAHSPDGEFCFMEAAAYIAGEEWTDHPKCVSSVIGAFLRSWNDSLADKTRQKLKPFIRKVLNTSASTEVEQVRAWMACDWLVRTFTPTWLRKAGLDDQAAALEALPELTSSELAEAAMPAIREAKSRADAVGDACWAAVGDAAWAAARDAARAAARDGLESTVLVLQASAHDLFRRMIVAT